jgi:putative glycosyltransferase (TIGR04372 family)
VRFIIPKQYIRPSIKKHLRLFPIRLGISILNWRRFSLPTLAPQEQVNTIRFSDVFQAHSTIDIERVYRQWKYSERIWNDGEYIKSVGIKKDILEYLYSIQVNNEFKHVPPFMSVGWGVAIGHIGSLGAFVLGQKLNLFPSNLRYLPVRDQHSSFLVKNFLQDSIGLASSRFGFAILENPSSWHLSERLQMVGTTKDFISLYEMHELVYKNLQAVRGKVRLSINPDYETWAEAALRKLGLPRDAWFVGLHVREKPANPLDPRTAKLETFYQSISEIEKRGGWIIRFGTGVMTPLPSKRNILDLNIENEDLKRLHLYVIAKSLFLLSTNSGPNTVAWALGTPVLQTNTLSIARNILSSSDGSLFLPKKYRFGRGQPCSFSQIIGSNSGYWEKNLREISALGFELIDNSEEEILEATKDMFHFVEKGNHNALLKSRVNEIRKSCNAVGYGQISPSFLHRNENWFLS